MTNINLAVVRCSCLTTRVEVEELTTGGVSNSDADLESLDSEDVIVHDRPNRLDTDAWVRGSKAERVVAVVVAATTAVAVPVVAVNPATSVV